MTELSIQAEPAGAAPGSLPKRIVDTFFAPVDLFRRFGPKAPWWDVMLVAVVLGTAAMALVPTEVWVQTTRDAMANNPNAQGDPEAFAGLQRGIGIGASLVAPWIFLFIQSAILLVIFTMLMGGEATYRQYLAVGAHAALVGALGQLITLPLMIRQGSMQAGISLKALMPGAEGFLPAFLGAFNVFLVWQVALLAVGAAAVNRGRSVGSALAVLFGIFVAIAAVIGLVAAR